MDYREALSKLHEGRLSRLLVFYGPERYLIDDFIEKILKQKSIDKESLQFKKWAGKEFDRGAFLSFVNTLGFFSEEKLAVIESAQDLFNDKTLLKELESIEDATVCFIFDEKKGLSRSLEKISDVITMKRISKGEMRNWIAKQFSLSGKRIRKEDIQRIVDYLGYFDYGSKVDLYYIQTEIKRIASTEEDPIESEHIQRSLGRPLEENVFEILERIVEKDREKALVLYDEFVRSGQSPYLLIPLLSRNYKQIHTLKKLSENYYAKQAIMTKLGIKSDFIFSKLQRSAKGLTLKETAQAMELCLKYEAISKSITLNLKDHVEDLLVKLMG